MSRSVSFHVATAILTISLSVALFSSFAFAQTPTREKPKLKDFGSSLKRLKWDPERNAAVETKRKKDKAKGSEEEDVVRVETTLIVCDVLVLDQQGHPVLGLTEGDFLLTEDGQPQQVGIFSLGDNASIPRSIVLVIDYSGSLLPYINMSVEATKTLVDQLGPKDRMAIVTDDIKLLEDFTQDKAKLKSKLESLKKKALDKDAMGGWFRGHSLQFSALMASLRELFSAEDVRPVVIFQTDGDELGLLQPQPAKVAPVMKAIAKNFSLADLYKEAEKSRATIYSIVPGIRLIGFSESEQIERARKTVEEETLARTKVRAEIRVPRAPSNPDLRPFVRTRLQQQSALAELSAITGGWASFLEDPSQTGETYTRIFSDINRRYIVGYYPTNKEHDGKRRKVNVEVRGHPEYIVMGRKSYYAAEPDQ
jgi:VWFA-related protein